MSSRIEIVPIKDTIGAEVKGVDLAAPLDDPTVDALRGALNEYSVLVLRGQELAPREHVQASRRFGDLELHVLDQYRLDGAPEIFVVSNVEENGRAIGIHDGAWHWHSDSCFHETPSLGSLFYCLECPPEGGETEFCSMFAPYDRLDAATRAWVNGKIVVFDYADFYARTYNHLPPMTEAQKARVPPVGHPMVRTHPETGRPALYFNKTQVREIIGVPEDEGRQRLEELEEFVTRPEFVYSHQWSPGDMVFWDNRSCMHRARPFDDKAYRRLMHRTTLVGDKPYYQA